MSGSPHLYPEAPKGASFGFANAETARSVANRAAENHGESREQVLESGGRVDTGVTTKRGVSVGTGDSGRESRTTPAVILGQTAGDLS